MSIILPQDEHIPSNSYGMSDITLADMARTIRWARLWIVAATLAGIGIAASIAFSVPSEYRAEGLLLAGGRAGNSATLEGINVARDGFSAPAIKRIVDSDQILHQVATDLLAAGPVELDSPSWRSAILSIVSASIHRILAAVGAARSQSLPPDPANRLSLALRQHMATVAELESGTVTVTYSDPDPVRAAGIANRIMTAVVDDRQRAIDQDRLVMLASLTERLRHMRAEIDAQSDEVGRLREQLEFENTPAGSVLDRRVTEASRALSEAIAARVATQVRLSGAERAIGEDAVSNRESGMLISPLLEKLRQDQARASQEQAHASNLGPMHPYSIAFDSELKRINAAISAESTRILTELRNAVTDAEAREASERQNLEELRRLERAGIPDRYRVTAIEQKIAAKQGEFDGLSRLLEYYRLPKGNDSGVHIAAVAVPPSTAAGPHRMLAVMLGGVIGLIGAVVVSLFRGALLGLYAAPERYGDLVGARQVYAFPNLPRRVAKGAWRYVTRQHPPEAETGHRSVRDMVRWFMAHRGAHGLTVTITSAVPGEGKTTLSALLARTSAAMGFNTLLIDADLLSSVRKRELDYMNVIHGNSGETSAVSSICRIQQTPVAGLLVGVAHHYSSLFRTENRRRVREPIDELAKRFDLIIITASPLLSEMESLIDRPGERCDRSYLRLDAGWSLAAG
jgi:uncharacterized protein involved in exopolysaccharide biosynthesis